MTNVFMADVGDSVKKGTDWAKDKARDVGESAERGARNVGLGDSDSDDEA